jgi:ribosomal protein S6E (S10)
MQRKRTTSEVRRTVRDATTPKRRNVFEKCISDENSGFGCDLKPEVFQMRLRGGSDEIICDREDIHHEWDRSVEGEVVAF